MQAQAQSNIVPGRHLTPLTVGEGKDVRVLRCGKDPYYLDEGGKVVVVRTVKAPEKTAFGANADPNQPHSTLSYLRVEESYTMPMTGFLFLHPTENSREQKTMCNQVEVNGEFHNAYVVMDGCTRTVKEDVLKMQALSTKNRDDNRARIKALDPLNRDERMANTLATAIAANSHAGAGAMSPEAIAEIVKATINGMAAAKDGKGK